MAFKMNRPIIKGTASHKASIAKAVDASLIEKANVLGMSDVPHAIDYGLRMPDIDVKRKKKEKDDKDNGGDNGNGEDNGNGNGNDETTKTAKETAEELEKLGEEKTEEAQANKQKTVEQAKEQAEKQGKTFEMQWKREEDTSADTEPDIGHRGGKTYKQAWKDMDAEMKAEYDNYKEFESEAIEWNKQQDAKKKEEKAVTLPSFQPTGYKEVNASGDSSSSPATKRDNRIWRNAKKGGSVRKNMLKNGYKPK